MEVSVGTETPTRRLRPILVVGALVILSLSVNQRKGVPVGSPKRNTTFPRWQVGNCLSLTVTQAPDPAKHPNACKSDCGVVHFPATRSDATAIGLPPCFRRLASLSTYDNPISNEYIAEAWISVFAHGYEK